MSHLRNIIIILLLFIVVLFSSFVHKTYADVCNPITTAPLLYQINRTASQATLYFTPINDQIASYTIIYGLSSGDQRYSTMFNSGPSTGAVSYTINNLQPGVQYFYEVQATNTCGDSSPWSNWVGDKEKAIVATKLPITGSDSLVTGLSISFGAIALGLLLFRFSL